MGKCRFGASLFLCVGHVVLYIRAGKGKIHFFILLVFRFFQKSYKKEYNIRFKRFFSNFGTFMYLSLRRPLSAKEKSMLFHP